MSELRSGESVAQPRYRARVIENLEMHVTHACNLACESCSHYSNHGHKGSVPLEEADRWMRAWKFRVAPKVFSLLGGEPAIHPRLSEFVPLVRGHWPQAHLRIVTNGFFLHRHPGLPLALKGDPNACIYLSVHHEARDYLDRLAPAISLLGRWQRDHGTKVVIYRSARSWRRTYEGFGASMEPFDDRDPRRSWERCAAKACMQLFEGNVWKCAPLAYLRMQDERFGLSDSWKPYLRYEPLPPDCSDESLNEFFDREEESFCAMCPAEPKRFDLPMPIRSLAAESR